MRTLEDDLRAALRAQAQALRVPERPALDRDIDELHRRRGPRWLAAAACLALIAAGVVALAQRRAGHPEPAPPVASVVPDTTTPTPVAPVAPDTTAPGLPVAPVVPDTTAPGPVTNGWIALHSSIESDGDDDIYLVRPGEDPRRLEVAGWDTTHEACPTWSPDGNRLMFGRLTGSNDNFSDPELVIVPVGLDGAAGTPTVIALDGFGALPGFSPFPCGIWAPDGRWVALRGPGDVWVIDTQTSAIRRLPDLRPLDFEWRPGTDELAVAGDMGMTRGADWLSTPVSVYSVSTGEFRQLESIRAGQLTWSPDGSTLAYTGVEQQDGLRLVDADGTNDRVLVADPGAWNHGVGPVWSPTGDRIAYQRICCSRSETHEVVLVDVADGTQTVIPPPETVGPSGPLRWYPWAVTWSPDGTTLLYNAWSSTPERDALLAVPADTPSDVTVLTDTATLQPGVHQWVLIENWGRQP